MNWTQFLQCDGGIFNGHDETGQSLDESNLQLRKVLLDQADQIREAHGESLPADLLGIRIVLIVTISIKSTYGRQIPESKNSMLADT